MGIRQALYNWRFDMGITYDPPSKKWNITYEKTDFPILKTDYPIQETIELWAIPSTKTVPGKSGQSTTVPITIYSASPPEPAAPSTGLLGRSLGQNATPAPAASSTGLLGKSLGRNAATTTAPAPEARKITLPVYYTQEDLKAASQGQQNAGGILSGVPQNQTLQAVASTLANAAAEKNKSAKADNEYNTELNAINLKTKTENEAKNAAYDKTYQVATTAKGGDYVTQREAIRSLQGIDDKLKSTLENNFKASYLNEKLETWDGSKLGAKPAYGDFDAAYYAKQNPELKAKWESYKANDDVDVINRYGENGYYLQHYTQQGRSLGLRGNATEATAAANQYLEKKPTDKELQAVRDLQLGADIDTQTTRLLAVPEINSQYEKALAGDAYWTDLGKKNLLDPKKPDEFAALFRLSQRPEDKQIAFSRNINAGYGVTELEDAINTAVGEKGVVDVKRFGALAQNVLQDTIDEMKKARSRESMLSYMNEMGDMKEILNIGKTLSTDIMGDSGIGGVLAFNDQSGVKQESLEKSLQNLSGVNNLVTYNWQQWFDNSLKEKYSKDIELGYTTEQAKENVQIDGAFAKDFIEKYLNPRFNQAKSMEEFVDYLDVQSKEQNPFQTQDLLNATKLVADLKAQTYLDQIQKENDRGFNSAFYFNPTGDKSRQQSYADQAKSVQADWEAAKKGDSYWASQAYRFGVDVNDKDAFARMHFQVKGQGQGYDAAEDILNASKVTDEIYKNILPALNKEVITQGSVFGQFITPESFADQMTKGLDPGDSAKWDEVLKINGLTGFKGTLDELKAEIAGSIQGSSAEDIRTRIEELNKQGEKPTQENLGITYIQRDSDYTNKSAPADTQLYQTFKKAGYKGTEDEFYTNFFPDTDRSEQAFLTKAGSTEGLQMASGLTSKDPFEALTSVSSMFGDDDTDTPFTTTSGTTKKTSSPSYFNLDLGLDDDDDDTGTTKSKSGQEFLSSFTSLFK